MTRVPLFRLRKGSILVMDGRRLRVAACEESSVYLECEDTKECISRPFAQIEAAIRARDCDVISPDDVAKRAALLDYTGGYEDLAQLPENALADVQGRLALVTAMRSLMDEGVKLTQRSMNKCGEHRYRLLEKAHELAPKCNFLRSPRGGKSSESFLVPQGRTLDRYLKIYEKFGNNPVVLADRDHLKGIQESRLVPWQKNFVMFTVNRILQKKSRRLRRSTKMRKTTFIGPRRTSR